MGVIKLFVNTLVGNIELQEQAIPNKLVQTSTFPGEHS